ncbi:MAG: hypothetical protein DRI26_05465, partial [Chloroflexi bacterium]
QPPIRGTNTTRDIKSILAKSQVFFIFIPSFLLDIALEWLAICSPYLSPPLDKLYLTRSA